MEDPAVAGSSGFAEFDPPSLSYGGRGEVFWRFVPEL